MKNITKFNYILQKAKSVGANFLKRHYLLLGAWVFFALIHLLMLHMPGIPGYLSYISILLLSIAALWTYLKSVSKTGELKGGKFYAKNIALFLFVFIGIGFFFGAYMTGALRQSAMLGLAKVYNVAYSFIFASALFAAAFYGLLVLVRSSKLENAETIEKLLLYGVNSAVAIAYLMLVPSLVIMLK